MPLPEGPLESVKNRLDITWDDKDTDRKIEGIIEEGMFYIDEKLGVPGDYMVAGYPRTLLMEYCRYSRDNALDVFENNYLSQILAMQIGRKVMAFEEVSKQTT